MSWLVNSRALQPDWHELVVLWCIKQFFMKLFKSNNMEINYYLLSTSVFIWSAQSTLGQVDLIWKFDNTDNLPID